MLSNYLLTAWRHAQKNAVYILINMLGLAFGIASCTVSFFNWQFHEEFDGQHLNSETIYKVNSIKKDQGELHKYATTPAALASSIPDQGFDIEAARYWAHQSILRIGEKVLKRPSAFTDPSFTSIFTFHLIEGSFDLSNNGIILTKQFKEELFGPETAIGQSLELILDGQVVELQLNGIIEDHKLNSSFQFEVLMSYNLYRSIYGDANNSWITDTHATFISSNLSVSDLEFNLNKFVENVNVADPKAQLESFYVTPLKEIANEA